METIDGRQYATRAELSARAGYKGDATLRALWADREGNGHPPARRIDRVLYWDLEVWERWFTEYQRQRNGIGIDYSGNPDEELPPVDQAKVLGMDLSVITNYSKNPPPGWPEPVRREELESGRFREYRTRRQLWAYVASRPLRPRAGIGGRKPAEGPDPRVALAIKALAAEPGRKAGETAAALAEQHGGGLSTWKRAVTEARRQG
ncbi:hypothetical protein [Streptomyces sp. RLB3-6]|uniref:hypothetical protein n=1 Tax=Streptomyces sp. RLB3-6 TaxID=2594457 RepID=UPI00116441F8|nr:hypothetical protein [Streptomyces sp. RLB3-6]QDN84381.1 hypothetical protein FNV61_00190 [Streptomyces sp. RLB3-6]